MIDAHSALRTHLLVASPLKTLLGGDYVYWPEVPSNVTLPRKAISFRFGGGLTLLGLRAQDARVTFKCWGTSAFGAMEVYRALYDRLHDQQNFIVGNVGIHGAYEDVPGEPLEDPKTGYLYVHTVYTLTVATVPVAA